MKSIEKLVAQHKPMEWELPHLPYSTPSYDRGFEFPMGRPFGQVREQPFGIVPTIYCGGAQIKPTSNGFVIPLPVPSGVPIKDLHETSKIDRYNNLYNGHTTVTYNNNNKNRFNW